MDQAQFLHLVDETLELKPGTATMSDSLEALDWDSLANIGFIAAVDTNYGVTVDAERLAACETPADLFALVQESVGATR